MANKGQRNGDIRAILALSQAEALNGTRRTLKLPGGRQIVVPVPAGAHDGQEIRLEGQGRPSFNGGRGTLILIINTTFSANALPPRNAVPPQNSAPSPRRCRNPTRSRWLLAAAVSPSTSISSMLPASMTGHINPEQSASSLMTSSILQWWLSTTQKSGCCKLQKGIVHK